jgi:hypothetical protein
VRSSQHLLTTGLPKSEPSSLPSSEVVANGDRTLRTEVIKDGPVLLEGGRALNGWGVGTGGLQDTVGGAIGVDGADFGRGAAGVVGTVVLNNVVLDQGVGGPTVDGEVGVTVGGVGAGEGDGTRLWSM